MIDFGELIKASRTFNLIGADFSNWTYHRIVKGDTLVVLVELDLTSVSAAAVATDLAVGAAYWEVYEQAQTEFKKNGKIKGFEVLNPKTLQKLWISHFDMKLLLENQT